MRGYVIAAALFLGFSLGASLEGQAQMFGTYGFGSFDNYGVDSIDRGDLNLMLQIPVISKPGRAHQDFTYGLQYNGLIWSNVGSTWQPAAGYGWTATGSAVTGIVTHDTEIDDCEYYSGNPRLGYLDGVQKTYSNYVYVQRDGRSFPFPFGYTTTCGRAGGSPPAGTEIYPLGANSGLTLVYNSGSFTVYTSSGETLSLGGMVTDSNGNQLSASGTTFVDTMGMTVLTQSGSGTASSPTVYTYTDFNGHSQTVTLNYTNFNVQTAFGVSGVAEFSQTAVPLLTSVVYSADSSSYSFTYEPTPGSPSTTTGRLASTTLRTGGTVSYSYFGADDGMEADNTLAGLTRTTSDGSITYTRSSETSTSSTTTVTDADSNAAVSLFAISANYYFEYDRKSYSGPPSGTLLTERRTCYNGDDDEDYTACYPGALPSITDGAIGSAGITDIAGDNAATTGIYWTVLNSNGLLSQQANNQGVFYYSYQTFTPSSGISFFRVSEVDTSGVFSEEKTKIYTYGYDETSPVATSGLPSHTTPSPSPGNRTSTHAWYSASAHRDQTTAYDDAGQVLSQSDWNGNLTAYAYDSTDTQLVKTTLPNGLYANQAEDPNTGLLSSMTDYTHLNTTYSCYDGLGRPTAVYVPGVTPNCSSLAGATVLNSYSSPTTTVTQVSRDGTHYNTNTVVLDGYGRTHTSTQTNTEEADETSTSSYDENGRLHSVTNPQRSSSNPTDGTTVYNYDAVGRVVKVTAPDGVSATVVDYLTAPGYQITTDPQSKQTKMAFTSDGTFGGVVYEPDATGVFSLYTSTSLNPFGQVIQSSQWGGSTPGPQARNRYFNRDNIGRVTSSVTPEQGTTSYSYLNSSGVPCSGQLNAPCIKTDANGTVTTYTYDSLNRLTGKSYVPGSGVAATPSVVYHYDETSVGGTSITNGAGQRTSMVDGSGSSVWSYDTLGRVLMDQRAIGSVTKTNSYQYNPDNTLKSTTDVAGNVVNYSYSSTSRLLSATDAATGTQYVSSLSYYPIGALHNGTLGNGVYLSNSFNPLGQPTAITASAAGSSIFGLAYGYGASGQDNGNVTQIVNSMDATRDVNFGYDQLNRLQTAQAGTLWGYTYGYDNWGNLTSMSPSSGISTMETALTTSANVSNQFQLAGFGYDSDGNMTSDGFNTYTYDAEGRIHSVSGYTYTYDGDGLRVEKSSGSTGTMYWPDMNGAAQAETNLSGGSLVRNVYLGKMQVARRDSSGNWSYFLHDHLGSTRMVLDNSASVVLDTDYFPFGGTAYQTGSSSNLYGFTGYEADGESSSNYAVFRNESPSLGRFMRPDPYDGSYDFTNPQSLNRYSYVGNNPLIATDPFGLTYVVCTTDGTCTYYSDNSWNNNGYGAYDSNNQIDSNGNIVSGPDGVITGAVYHFPDDFFSQGPNPNTKNTSGGAPNNGQHKTPQQCAGEALKKNAVALTLDVAGVGAGFLPGGDLVVAGVQATISVASGINGAVQYDGTANAAAGTALGVLGLPATFTSYAAKAIGVGGKALPGVGAVISGLGALSDAYGTYKDYQSCMAGHS